MHSIQNSCIITLYAVARRYLPAGLATLGSEARRSGFLKRYSMDANGEERKRYREILKDQVGRGVMETSFEHFKERVALGSTEFVERLKTHLNKADNRELEGRHRFIDYQQVVATVETAKEEPRSEWLDHQGNRAKWIVLWLGDPYSGLTQKELGLRMGNKDYASVSTGISRFGQKQKEERTLRELLKKCLNILNVKTRPQNGLK